MRRNFGSIDRRRFLKGAGVTVLLPWLESLPAFGATPGATPGAGATLRTAGQPPTRFASFYFPNGVQVTEWGATGEGDGLRFKKVLEPLEPVKRKVIVPSGLWHERLDSRGAHTGKTSGFLSGIENYKFEGNRLRVGVSIDQLIAQKIGGQTPLPSLCLGIKPDSKIDTDYSSVYRSYISWKSPSQPAGKEIDPRFAYLLDAPESDPDGNPAALKFSRKTREQFVASERNGKPTAWRAHYRDGRWVEQAGAAEAGQRRGAARSKSTSRGRRKT